MFSLCLFNNTIPDKWYNATVILIEKARLTDGRWTKRSSGNQLMIIRSSISLVNFLYSCLNSPWPGCPMAAILSNEGTVLSLQWKSVVEFKMFVIRCPYLTYLSDKWYAAPFLYLPWSIILSIIMQLYTYADKKRKW